MYEAYADIYDLAGQGRFGAELARWVLAWQAARGELPARVLDLACGSGAAALPLAQAGCAVVGVDTSLAMLSLAQAKARDAGLAIEWIVGDMRDLRELAAGGRMLSNHAARRTPHVAAFDLVTCFADSLNYLIDDGDLARVFGGAAVALRSGGWLVFDMNSEAEYATWDDREVVAYDSPDLLVYQMLRYNRRTQRATGKIGWFVREIDRWWRDAEIHVQRAWRENEVREALTATGFAVVHAETAPGAQHGRRMVYVVQKA